MVHTSSSRSLLHGCHDIRFANHIYVSKRKCGPKGTLELYVVPFPGRIQSVCNAVRRSKCVDAYIIAILRSCGLSLSFKLNQCMMTWYLDASAA